MTEAVRIGNATLYCGDCLDVLRTLPDASIEAIVTDPPYGLAFMGKHWDYDVPAVEVWQECLRVLKPGGHLLAFAGTRTFHRMAVRIEDAGFEIRDMIAWVYGSGFPKSLDVSKALDKLAGAERETTGWYVRPDGQPRNIENWQSVANADRNTYSPADQIACKLVTAPATDAARQWSGWGTALKPALEPIALCRKPLDGTVAQNVLAHGTGSLNIDASRVGDFVETWPASRSYQRQDPGSASKGTQATGSAPPGRFPANLIHDGSDEVVTLFPVTENAPEPRPGGFRNEGASKGLLDFKHGSQATLPVVRGDCGSAARFFYCAKADPSDRDEGLDGFDRQATAFGNQAQAELKRGNHEHADGKSGMNKVQLRRNHHPTVKPTDLMRYLCRLVAPPGGTILDPFMGSGSTGRGAALEGFHFIGIEREPDYLAIAKARIKAAQRQPDLFHAAVAA